VEQFLTTETIIIELLLIVSLVAIAVHRLRVPYTVALVLVGLLITFQQRIQFELTPELILILFLPPLVFEAAFHIEIRRLRDNLLPIVVLAVPGVLLTTLIIGWIVAKGAHLPLSTALVFGALISATDPVAVVSLFRTLGAPKRLAMIVEGESLFNDGTAIVMFNLMVIAVLPMVPAGGEAHAESFQWVPAIVDFIRVSAGGVGIGIGLGWLISLMITRLDDYLIETTLTTVLAFGAYLIADRFHVSGVLAVVSAGIITGNIGPKGMSPTTRIVLFNFWEYLAFVANSLVFLLIGLGVNIGQILSNLSPIAIAVLAVIISRALVVYGLTGLSNLRRRKVPWSYQHVLFWGGLRGAVSLALALSLPSRFAEHSLLRVMTFGVVLFTLLVQGTTMQLLMRRLGLVRIDESTFEYERERGRLMATRAARERLQQLYNEGIVSASTWESLSPDLDRRIQAQIDSQRDLLRNQPALWTEELDNAKREGLRAQRAMLASLLSDGVISERAYRELVTEVDAALEGEAAEGSDGQTPKQEQEKHEETAKES
jgi:Na+:H+ antiporter